MGTKWAKDDDYVSPTQKSVVTAHHLRGHIDTKGLPS